MNDKKITALHDEALEKVAGGAAEPVAGDYNLAVSGHGRWYDEGNVPVSTISVLGTPPYPSFTLTYVDPFHTKHTVSAKPDIGYAYGSDGVVFDAATGTYTATFQ